MRLIGGDGHRHGLRGRLTVDRNDLGIAVVDRNPGSSPSVTGKARFTNGDLRASGNLGQRDGLVMLELERCHASLVECHRADITLSGERLACKSRARELERERLVNVRSASRHALRNEKAPRLRDVMSVVGGVLSDSAVEVRLIRASLVLVPTIELIRHAIDGFGFGDLCIARLF